MTYMPGAHSYTIQLNLTNLHYSMAQDLWTMQEEKKSKPVHGPPLQARVVAANRAVLANFATILAHMAMNKGRGKCKTERGQTMRAADMAWQRRAGKHSLQN